METKYKRIFKIRINYKSGNSFEGWFSVFKFEKDTFKWESTPPPDVIEELYNLLKYNDFDNIKDFRKIKIAKKLVSYQDPILLGVDNIEAVFQMESVLVPIIPKEKLSKVDEYIQQLMGE